MWEMVRTFDLCPKLSGLQLRRGFALASVGDLQRRMRGGGVGGRYNAKVQKAVNSFFETGNSVAIIGAGRKADENSLVLVEKGKLPWIRLL